MNKFSFPVNIPKPKHEPLLVKSLSDYLYKVQAIMLFNNITGFGLENTKNSFELSFDANQITLREFGEWVRAYYKEKAQ